MQFITTDQRIAVENFEVGVVYTIAFTSGDSFTGSCMGIGVDFVAFQRTAPEYIFCLTMTTAADVASIEPLSDDIGKIIEYTGLVPISIKTDGSPLLSYIINGNILPGTGERTGNLFDKSKRTDNSRVVYTTGEIGALNGVFVSDFTPIEPNTTYTLNIVSSISSKTGHLFALYDENKNFVNTGAHEAISTTTVYTFTTPSNVSYIRFNGNMANVDEIMLNTGSTALPYEPYGYKIPVISGGTTTNIYLDNPLRKSLDGTAVDELSSYGKLTQRVDTDGSILATPIISYIDTPTIPTTDGLSIFDIDTTVKPSEVYLKYFSPLF